MTNTMDGRAQAEGRVTDLQDPFGSLTPMAKQEAVELHAIAEERRRYLATLGSTPAAAFRVLMSADFVLRNGLPDQKISVMLQLIKDYGIDIDALKDAKDAGRITAAKICQ